MTTQPPQCSPEQRKSLLTAFLAPLREKDQALADDTLSFVCNGAPGNAPARLLATAGSAQTLHVICGWVPDLDRTPHLQLIKSLGGWPEEELLRLAQVYQATSGAASIQGYTISRTHRWSGQCDWLAPLISQLLARNPYAWHSEYKPAPITLERIERLMELDGKDPALLLKGILQPDTNSYGWERWTMAFAAFADLHACIGRRGELVMETLQAPDFKLRVNMLETLALLKVPVEPWRGRIAELSVQSAKLVRSAAEPLLRAEPEVFLPLLEALACDAENEMRALALQTLHRIYGEQVRPFLQSRAAVEKGKKASEVLTDILKASDPQAKAEVDDWKLEPVILPPMEAPLPAIMLQEVRACIASAYSEALAKQEECKKIPWMQKFKVGSLPADMAEQTLRFLETGEHGTDTRKAPMSNHNDFGHVLANFAGNEHFTLLHLCRWCALWTREEEKAHWVQMCVRFLATYIRRNGPLCLRNLAATAKMAGLDDGCIGNEYLGQWTSALVTYRHPIFRGGKDTLWPYFAERVGLIEQAMGLGQSQPAPEDFQTRNRASTWRTNALTLLTQFPRPPRSVVRILWESALGGPKAEREPAQLALANESDLLPRLMTALTHAQAEIRTEAAGWIGRLPKERAAPAEKALREALAKEKKELAQSAMMRALELLGVPISELVDRESLEKEATKQAAKPLPADLEWFPLDRLPPLHWTADNKPIPAELTRLLLVQAHKMKNPEPSPLLRTYASLFTPATRLAVGRFIAEAWMAQDTLPAHTSEEAARLADENTAAVAASYKQYSPNYFEIWDEEKHRKAAYSKFLEACKGSAIASKGILAMAGAFADGSLAAPVHRYVKTWFGMRVGQCKALLQMLAWIDDPTATQVLLAVGNRFRTKSIQEEATRLSSELAERKGWTLDELADRTVPTAGMDERGVLSLDYGTRTFEARLNEDYGLTLFNADGREIASLPEANRSDNEELAKQAKATLSAARKELKGIVKMQQERLYEAMCTQRSWSLDDLRTHLFAHPVVGRLCQRLVWRAHNGTDSLASFRPLPGGSLTNTADDEVELPGETRVCLAHEATLSGDERDAWLAHFPDYKVEPLFAQFGKPVADLSGDKGERESIDDFRGHVVENFRLRSRLTKLGYTRGPAGDGGWFSDYHKRFPGLGMKATIEFSGSPLPEENKPVALITLRFESTLPDQGADLASFTSPGAEGVPLKELPRVLVSECWNDLRLAALDGKGFDPDWEKTVAY